MCVNISRGCRDAKTAGIHHLCVNTFMNLYLEMDEKIYKAILPYTICIMTYWFKNQPVLHLKEAIYKEEIKQLRNYVRSILPSNNNARIICGVQLKMVKLEHSGLFAGHAKLDLA